MYLNIWVKRWIYPFIQYEDYAKNLRLHSKPSQTIITVTKERVCENIHIIELD